MDEHTERLWLPQRHAEGIKAMLARHKIGDRKMELGDLKRFVAGTDVFSRQSDGIPVVAQYARLGINLRVANTDRLNGWVALMTRFGDVEPVSARHCLFTSGVGDSPKLSPRCNTIRTGPRTFSRWTRTAMALGAMTQRMRDGIWWRRRTGRLPSGSCGG